MNLPYETIRERHHASGHADLLVIKTSDDDKIYPCAKCGTMRSKAEGGTVFTVCDDCWDNPPTP